MALYMRTESANLKLAKFKNYYGHFYFPPNFPAIWYRDFDTSCSKCRHYVQNTEVLVVYVQRQLRSLQLSYTELRIIAGQWTISDQLCCMCDHFSEICNISCQAF